ncbi:MAG: hypothetical protein ACI9NQ_002203, partial [Paracoccaceae bacterium]
DDLSDSEEGSVTEVPVSERQVDDPESGPETPELKKKRGNQGELLLNGAPKGRFDGEKPNTVEDSEDLDVPPYLRRRGRLR